MSAPLQLQTLFQRFRCPNTVDSGIFFIAHNVSQISNTFIVKSLQFTHNGILRIIILLPHSLCFEKPVSSPKVR